MKHQIFCVYDSAAEQYTEPFYAPTHHFALRNFRRLVNEPGHQFNTYPEDYTIYHIGEYDGDTGVITPQDPRSLGVAVTFKEITPDA